MKKIVVVEQPEIFTTKIDGVEFIRPKEYLTTEIKGRCAVYNLSASYHYQSTGYYVSLLAEGRDHLVFPSIKSLNELKDEAIYMKLTYAIEGLIQKLFKNLVSKEFTLSIYFGKNLAKQYDKLSFELYKIFPVPLFRAKFVKKEKWYLKEIVPIPMSKVPKTHLEFLNDAAAQYLSRSTNSTSASHKLKYDLAILVNPEEEKCPSNKKAIDKFLKSAKKHGFHAELITPKDYLRLSNFDALFIRETTNVNHHTYQFASKAEALGMVVYDDPQSILKCTNKVYLAEILRLHKIPAPETTILYKDLFEEQLDKIEYPCVLKLPDSSFAIGVHKVKNKEEMTTLTTELFERSELLISQEFLPSDYDWRIGILNNTIFYACKYFMARDHWQIYNWKEKSKKHQEGLSTCIALQDIPKDVAQAALRSAALIGNGFYGIDLKEIDGKVYVIEINDNPSIEAGVEDEIEGDKLYDFINATIKQKLEAN